MSASLLSLFFSLLTPVVLEYLKSQPWAPFIEAHRPKLNAVVAAIVAVGQTIGVSFAFDATAGTLVIGGLVLSDIARIGATAALAWIVQELTYRVAVKK